MNKQTLLDSIPVGSRVTDGKDPMRDLPIGGRRPRPAAKQEDPYEAQLIRVLRTWMKNPAAPQTLETLSGLMLAHEIRSYNTVAKPK
jgi:hypothetical protein